MRENPDVFPPSQTETLERELEFEVYRPSEESTEGYVRKFYFPPTESVMDPKHPGHLREYPVDTWVRPDPSPLLEYGTKWRCLEQVRALMARFESEVSSPGYQEALRAILAEKADALVKQQRIQEENAARQAEASRLAEAKRAQQLALAESYRNSRILSREEIAERFRKPRSV